MSGPYFRTAFERELDALERELESAETDDERRAIREAMNDAAREESDRENWELEGRERGWS